MLLLALIVDWVVLQTALSCMCVIIAVCLVCFMGSCLIQINDRLIDWLIIKPPSAKRTSSDRARTPHEQPVESKWCKHAQIIHSV